MHKFRRVAFTAYIVSMVLFIPFFLVGCGGGDEGGAGTGTASLATLCGPRFNMTAGASCPDNLCVSGVIQGSAQDIGTLSFSTSDKMCTKRCNTNADCQGISFANTNDLSVVSESWSCVTSGSGNYCGVSVVGPGSGGDICSGCGGVFCSGKCIGCPQC